MMINKRLISTVENSKKYIIYNVMFQWISLIASVVLMGGIVTLIGVLYQGKLETGNRMVAFSMIAIICAVLIRFTCTILANRMSFLSSKAVKKVLREKIFDKLLKLGTSYEEEVKTSEVVQMAVEGVDQLEIYFGAYLPQFFLCHAGTNYLVRNYMLHQCACSDSSSCMCSVDSSFNRSSTDMGKEAFIKVLGTVYGAWRYIFRESPRINHTENISDRSVQE